MGFLSFLGGSYKPKDFVGKTIDQIFKDMKLDKMDKSIKEHEEYAGLSEEIKNAIDFLLDLKDGKMSVYEKCYKRKRAGVAGPEPAAVHHVARPASARPAAGPIARPASAPKPHPAPAAPAPVVKEEDLDEEEKKEGMSGGGRRGRKSRKGKKSKRRSHKKKRKTSRR